MRLSGLPTLNEMSWKIPKWPVFLSFFLSAILKMEQRSVKRVTTWCHISNNRFRSHVQSVDMRYTLLRRGFTWIGVKFEVVDPLKREPQIGRGLSGVRLLIFHVKFQFSKSIKSSIFPIFLNLTYPIRKSISFPKCPKITQKFTQNRKTLVYVLNRRI